MYREATYQSNNDKAALAARCKKVIPYRTPRGIERQGKSVLRFVIDEFSLQSPADAVIQLVCKVCPIRSGGKTEPHPSGWPKVIIASPNAVINKLAKRSNGNRVPARGRSQRF